jgi:hypothetical protein
MWKRKQASFFENRVLDVWFTTLFGTGVGDSLHGLVRDGTLGC